MSFASARSLFVLVLVINCILWSRSRYGRFPDPSLSYGETSLVKRVSYELLNPHAVHALDGFEKKVGYEVVLD